MPSALIHAAVRFDSRRWIFHAAIDRMTNGFGGDLYASGLNGAIDGLAAAFRLNDGRLCAVFHVAIYGSRLAVVIAHRVAALFATAVVAAAGLGISTARARDRPLRHVLHF